MSACNCDMKDQNGGVCGASCPSSAEQIVESRVSYTPVVFAKAGAVESIVSFEGCAADAACL